MKKQLVFAVVSALALSLFLTFTNLSEAASAGKPGGGGGEPIDPAIVYVTNGSLAIANATGSNQKIILSNIGGSPSWSPDGKSIVFVVGDKKGPNGLAGRGIYRIDIDRSTGQALGSPQKLAPLNSTYTGIASPVWSPVPIEDSAGVSRYFIAYSDGTPQDPDSYSIHLVDPELPGSAFKLSSPVVNTREVGDLHLTWAPDATRLAVTRGHDSNATTIYDLQIVTLQATDCPVGEPICEVQPRTSLVRDVPTAPPELRSTDFHHPRWSNDGEDIIITAGDVWIVPVDEPQSTWNLTNTGRHDTQPTWSPDDSQVAYRTSGYLCGSTNSKWVMAIVVRNVDGTLFPNGCEEKVLINDAGFPDWWRNHGK